MEIYHKKRDCRSKDKNKNGLHFISLVTETNWNRIFHVAIWNFLSCKFHFESPANTLNWKCDSFPACLRWRLSEIPVQIIYPASSWGLIRKQPITFGDLPLVDGLARFQNNSIKLARARLEKKAFILSNTDYRILSPFFNRCSHLKKPANELYFS